MNSKWDGRTERRQGPSLEEELVERIAESAVKKAFKLVSIDLDNEESVKDIQGLAFMMKTYRKTKKALINEIQRRIGQLIALLLIYYFVTKLGIAEILGKALTYFHTMGEGS